MTDLENYRQEIIKLLRENSSAIIQHAKDAVGNNIEVYIIGSVLDKNKFTEDSDIDIGIVVNRRSLSIGVSEELSELVQREFLHFPIKGSILNTTVFNRMTPKGIKLESEITEEERQEIIKKHKELDLKKNIRMYYV